MLNSILKTCDNDMAAAETLLDTCQSVYDGTVDSGRFSFIIAGGPGLSDAILTVDISENGSYSIV